MGEGLQFIDILIFAMIAAFLVYRLKSVLGRRHGEERQRPNPYAPRPGQQASRAEGRPADNIIPMPERAPAADAGLRVPEGPRSLAESIALVRSADPSFDEKQFLEGARMAFQMVVGAFAAGDTATLRPLLSDEVYGNFAAAIEERRRRGEVLETRIEQIADADVADADLSGRTALITVRFVSNQVNVTRATDGSVVDGDPDQAEEVVDLWTFARNTQSRDPNWTLVETRVPT